MVDRLPRHTPLEIARLRQEPTTTALQRAKAGGRLPRSSDIELLADVFAGVMFYHLLLSDAPRTLATWSSWSRSWSARPARGEP